MRDDQLSIRWHGRPVEELSIEELRDALRFQHRQVARIAAAARDWRELAMRERSIGQWYAKRRRPVFRASDTVPSLLLVAMGVGIGLGIGLGVWS